MMPITDRLRTRLSPRAAHGIAAPPPMLTSDKDDHPRSVAAAPERTLVDGNAAPASLDASDGDNAGQGGPRRIHGKGAPGIPPAQLAAFLVRFAETLKLTTHRHRVAATNSWPTDHDRAAPGYDAPVHRVLRGIARIQGRDSASGRPLSTRRSGLPGLHVGDLALGGVVEPTVGIGNSKTDPTAGSAYLGVPRVGSPLPERPALVARMLMRAAQNRQWEWRE